MFTFDPQAARQQMLDRQLRGRGIAAPAVLEAIARVPREQFLPAELHRHAYDDRALQIACGQTISQPYIVGLMTQALELDGSQAVLEVGTGSGYQTAILAQLARQVVSIERHARLSHGAAVQLGELGIRNVTLEVGDGTRGCPRHAPFDRIIVTAAAAACPRPLWDQLAEEGWIVIPLGGPGGQVLKVIRKRGGRPRAENLCSCRFVPLVGAQRGENGK